MIYFDNSASTPLTPAVKEVLREALEVFANPSSLHRMGFEAEKQLKEARQAVAQSVFAAPEEIVFTSGGTEADNTAIFGAVKRLRRRGNRILATDSEHPAVENCLRELEKEGFDVIRLSTKGGTLKEAEIAAAADEKTILGVCMHTNNETGAVYDVAAFSRLIKAKNRDALIFCDAVQGYLKTPLNFAAMGVDLAALSSHKICGPKGVGALYVKKGLPLPSLLFGGGQERGFRSGTENLMGILGFGAAAREGFARLSENRKQMALVRERVLTGLGGLEKITFNLPEKASCHILSMQVKGFRSEVLLHTLSEKEIFVSSGSACSAHSGKSGVLQHFGLTDGEADRTVRLSFSHQNTVEEADTFVRVLREIIGE